MTEEDNNSKRRRRASVNVKDLKKVIDMMKKAELTELDLEQEGLTIRLRRGSEPVVMAAPTPAAPVAPAAPLAPAAPAAPAPAPAAAPAPASAPAAEAGAEEGVTITAPMVGTFYQSPSPDAEAFVKVGSKVEAGQTVCIVEAMKLMNEIKSEVSGTITKVLIDNAQPVEYGQPLYVVKP